MPKEGYVPREEEIKKAEEMMTEEQRLMTYLREDGEREPMDVYQAFGKREGWINFKGVASAIHAVEWWARMACQRVSNEKGETTSSPPPPLPDEVFYGIKDVGGLVKILRDYSQEVLRVAEESEGEWRPKAQSKYDEKELFPGPVLYLEWEGSWTKGRYIEIWLGETEPGKMNVLVSWNSGTEKKSRFLDLAGAFGNCQNQAVKWGKKRF